MQQQKYGCLQEALIGGPIIVTTPGVVNPTTGPAPSSSPTFRPGRPTRADDTAPMSFYDPPKSDDPEGDDPFEDDDIFADDDLIPTASLSPSSAPSDPSPLPTPTPISQPESTPYPSYESKSITPSSPPSSDLGKSGSPQPSISPTTSSFTNNPGTSKSKGKKSKAKSKGKKSKTKLSNSKGKSKGKSNSEGKSKGKGKSKGNWNAPTVPTSVPTGETATYFPTGSPWPTALDERQRERPMRPI